MCLFILTFKNVLGEFSLQTNLFLYLATDVPVTAFRYRIHRYKKLTGSISPKSDSYIKPLKNMSPAVTTVSVSALLNLISKTIYFALYQIYFTTYSGSKK